MNDSRNGLLMNAIFLGDVIAQFSSKHAPGDSNCLLRGNLGTRLLLSRLWFLAPLLERVLHVIGVGSKEEVIEPEARGIVASMKHKGCLRWNRAKMFFPLKASDNSWFAVDLKAAISVLISHFRPDEAIALVASIFGKAFGNCCATINTLWHGFHYTTTQGRDLLRAA